MKLIHTPIHSRVALAHPAHPLDTPPVHARHTHHPTRPPETAATHARCQPAFPPIPCTRWMTPAFAAPSAGVAPRAGHTAFGRGVRGVCVQIILGTALRRLVGGQKNASRRRRRRRWRQNGAGGITSVIHIQGSRLRTRRASFDCMATSAISACVIRAGRMKQRSVSVAVYCTSRRR